MRLPVKTNSDRLGDHRRQGTRAALFAITAVVAISNGLGRTLSAKEEGARMRKG